MLISTLQLENTTFSNFDMVKRKRAVMASPDGRFAKYSSLTDK
jgi:hypothetical protein